MNFINIAQAGPIASAPSLTDIAVNAVEFVTSIVGVLAILMMVIGGVLYMTAGGDRGRVDMAKKTITGGIIGLVIAILSLTIVWAITTLV
jgi:hypothetical protein